MSRIKIKNFGPIREGFVGNDGWLDISKPRLWKKHGGQVDFNTVVDRKRPVQKRWHNKPLPQTGENLQEILGIPSC